MPNDPYGDLIATPSTAAAPDPYQNLMGPSTAPLRASLTLAADQNTDEFAKARQLARRLGHPEEAVRALPEEAKRQDLIQQVETDTAQAPVLRNSFLQNDFAVLAKGDTPALTKLEQGLRKFFDGGAYKQEAAYAAKVAGATAARALGGATVGVGATVFDAEAVAFDWLSGLTKGILPVDIPGQIAASARGSASAARGSLDFFLPKATNNLEAGLYSGGQSLGFNLATLPLAMEAAAVKGPEMAGHVMGLVAALATGAQTYNQGRDAGMGQIGATTFAAPAAMAEYLFEKWSGGKFFDDIAAKSGALKMLFNNATREVIGENATTLTQNFNEWLRLNPEKTVRDFVSEQPDAMIQTTIAALVGAGGMTGAVKLMQQFGDISVKQEDALHQHALLQGIMQTAAGSKLRELDPDTFSRFVQDAANGTEGAPKSMFVDGNTLAEVLNQAGVTEEQLAQALPSVSSQLADAVSMGAAVEIPLGELATALPGTPLEQALLPHLRTSEDAPSQMEAQQAQANAQEFLQTSAQRVIDQAADGVKAAASAEAVRKTMFDQLMATGRMSEDVASKNATLVREWYTVMSSMMGTTPEALYKAMPYTVQGAGQRGALTQFDGPATDLFPSDFANKATTVDTGIKVTSRGATLQGGNVNSNGQQITATKQGLQNFWQWFGNSATLGDDNKPVLLYHSTNGDFSTFEPGRATINSTTFGDVETSRHGIFLSPNNKFSQEYLRKGDGQNVMQVYAAIQNPIDLREGINGEDLTAIIDASGGKLKRNDFAYVDPYETWTFFDDESGKNFVEAAKAAGFDGAIMVEAGPEDNKPATTYVAFDPAQIKSATGNRGTFDGTDANILHQSAKPVHDQTQTEAFKRWSNDAPLIPSADAETHDFKSGDKVVVEAFHGTKRPDRVGTKFLKKRATSGPMAYHTSDPSLASSYATGKQDTSLADEDQSYETWFKFKPEGSRSSVDIVRAWHSLDAETKAKIGENAPKLRLSGDQESVEVEEGNTSGNGSYDYNLQQTQRGYDKRGNPLKALVEDWLNSGNLFNNEELFMQVLQKAGFPVKDVTYDSPHAEYPFVYKNYIAMQSPLVTSDVPQAVVDALNAAAKKDRSRAKYTQGADTWDKNTRTLKDWVAAFNSADNKYVWTSIPDKVTEVFKSLGYDGIIDWSGKGSGTEHPVYVPFNETQVKSALGNKGKFDGAKNDILNQGALDKPATAPVPQTETPAFKTWFGDSKVVDAGGKPLVVYHGTDADFEAFEPGSIGSNYGLDKKGFFFSSDRDTANRSRKSYPKGSRYTFSEQDKLNAAGGRVVDAYVSIKNPLTPKDLPDWESSMGTSAVNLYDLNRDAIEAALDSGKYDGVIIKAEGRTVIVPSSPTQIKSATGNNGNFDGTKASILRQDVQPNKYQQKYLSGRDVAGLTEEERAQYDALATPADLQQPQAQGPRGTFNPATLTTVLNENADLSTFLHETGHFFHEALMQLASQPDAPQEVKDLAAKALKVFGVKDIETWNAMDLEAKRPHYERFAETFELYLMTGKAPNVEIAGLFRTFRAWLTRVYKSLESFAQSKGITLDKDLKDVMDRMLATEAQIAEAEKVAGMVPELNATGEAIEQLQARSIRDLKWAVNARDKMIKALQKEAATKRKEVEEEVTAEVDSTPEMRAKKALDALRVDPDYTVALKTWNDERAEQLKQNQEALESELRTANPDVKGLAKGQLMMKNKRQIAANAELRTLEWEKQNPKPRRPVNTTDADVATVADSFGYESPEAMVQAIDAYGPRDVAIEGIADQRMLERYGDLTDPAAIAAAATEAVHNQARAKSLATELAAQREMLNKRDDTGKTNAKGQKVTVNALMEAAKQFAANVIGRRQIGDLKKAANSHLQAERRAAKAWEAATAKGDTQAAVQAKQDQVLNNAAVRAAQDAQAEVKKTMEFFAKVTKGNSETVVEKGRDPDVVNAARAILAVYGIAPFKGKNAFEYMSLVQANDPQVFAVLDASVKAAVTSAKPVGQMTVDELSALRDEIDSMWHLAKASREYEVDGNKMDIADAGEELKNRMVAKGIPDRIPGEGHAVTESERAGRGLQFAGALLRRVEQWAEGMDGKFGGPFLRLVFQPVKEAANRYRTDRVAYREAFTKLVENLSPAIKPGLIEAPEIGYTFGKGKGTAGAAELTHAILHLGNESNKRKLLLGRQWATENPDGTLNTDKWDAFIKRMHDTGVITKVHYDFAQGVWDLLEKMKPLAQKTHRDVFGRYFAEVTADVLSTPFGDYRGGYVPAQVDPEIVKDNEIRKLAEMENENMSYAFPSTNKGFTKSRTEYNRPLLLDIRALGQHMDKVLLFSHMEPAVRGVSKVLQEKGVTYSMNRIDPSAVSGMLTPWLNRSARQVVETPVVGDGRISRVLSAVRARAGMSVMFANVSNTLQQVAGVVLAGVKVSPSHLASAMAAYAMSPKKMSESVAKASEFMAHRMDDQISALNGTMEEILLNPSVYESAQAWAQKHAYFLQSALDNVIGPVVWTGAYNQAIKQGMEEKDAVRFADGTIRQTQGSTLPEDISRIETGPAYARVFTQFIGYFNMVANTNVTALQNIADDVGLKKGAGKALAVVFLGLLAPAWVAEAIALVFKGGPDDEDKDGSYLADWLMAVFGMGTLKTLLAGVPFVGQFAMAGVNTWNDKPYDDRTNLSPAVSMLEGSVGAPRSVYKALAENGSKQKAVRDVATAVSLATGLPASAIARPLGYLAGTADHKINPTSGADEARGLITGTASPQSKQQ